ncbi:unnamed protein product [Anisakis simplex]|uniref:Helicase POLQ-like (inferred by orthology to a human protein) n=1 Tax=Anisakis simplex TaxID=6269 RepID=A0A0M3JZ08_ANISI|nr:unnamed protein product [Anisakis simplex]
MFRFYLAFTFYSYNQPVKKLFSEWQKECLSDQKLLNGENMIISLPTGAGKTLIAEVLMLREAVVKKRSSILMLPYVAIVQEKVHSLSVFEEHLPLLIEEYAASKGVFLVLFSGSFHIYSGRLPPIKRRNKVSLFVATIEKANMLINSLIEQDRINEIGLFICLVMAVVEGPSNRHSQSLCRKARSGQIVGMSATLANLNELALFIRSSVFSTNFRPVELTERVKIDNTLYRVDCGGKLIPELDLPENKLGNRDPDGLVTLLRDIIPRRSAIIFCPTKQNCENVCALLTRLVPKSLCDMHTRERQLSVVALNEESDGKLSPTLRRGVLCGVAYHHSGLTADERQIIENAFQDGIIRILCSTSTLAAGVNLPARRVIIKSALIGREPLKKTQYLQMIGRAGRAGFDCKGEAITIVHRGMEEKNFRAMLSAPLMACKSAFSDKSILSSFIFDLISLKIANSLEEIEGILKMTLYGIQSGSTQSDINECLLELMNRKMIRQNSDAEYIVTTLGDAAFTANITPIAALSISESLIENLSMGIVLSSHFHLIYTIVPFDIYIDVDWDIYYEEYRALSSSEHRLLDTMGVEEKHLVKYFLQRPKLPAGDSALRLYLTFMMKRIWSEESIWSVAERFHVSRGWLQSTLQSTCSQASSIARFSEKVPQLWPLKHLLPDLVQRLRDCCQQELIPLLAIDGVKRARARMLYDAGSFLFLLHDECLCFKTPGAIASAEPSKLVSVVEHLNKRQAAKMISSAQMLVRDQIAEKVEEIEQMGIAVPQLCSQLMP